MKARFILQVRLKRGREDDLRRAYGALHQRVSEGVPGHLEHQLCQSADDPHRWIITSEWDSLDAALAWQVDPEHHELIKPMRELWEEAERSNYEVRVETSH
jgi:heme-degrading monooxygenase HmoA